MSYRSEHRESKGFLADGIGWRGNLVNREQAIKNAESMEMIKTNFEELVKQGLARKVVEKLPCRAIRIHYELIKL